MTGKLEVSTPMAHPGKMSPPANIEVISINLIDAFRRPSLWMEEERQANYDTFEEKFVLAWFLHTLQINEVIAGISAASGVFLQDIAPDQIQNIAIGGVL